MVRHKCHEYNSVYVCGGNYLVLVASGKRGIAASMISVEELEFGEFWWDHVKSMGDLLNSASNIYFEYSYTWMGAQVRGQFRMID